MKALLFQWICESKFEPTCGMQLTPSLIPETSQIPLCEACWSSIVDRCRRLFAKVNWTPCRPCFPSLKLRSLPRRLFIQVRPERAWVRAWRLSPRGLTVGRFGRRQRRRVILLRLLILRLIEISRAIEMRLVARCLWQTQTWSKINTGRS